MASLLAHIRRQVRTGGPFKFQVRHALVRARPISSHSSNIRKRRNPSRTGEAESEDVRREWRVGAQRGGCRYFPISHALFRSTMVTTTHTLENALPLRRGASKSIMHQPDYSIRAFLIPLLWGFRRLMYAGFSSSKMDDFPVACLSLLWSTIYLGLDMLFDPWPHGWLSLPISVDLALHHFSPTPPFGITADTMTFVLTLSAERGHGLVL